MNTSVDCAFVFFLAMIMEKRDEEWFGDLRGGDGGGGGSGGGGGCGGGGDFSRLWTNLS
jgi:hypothetical protein